MSAEDKEYKITLAENPDNPKKHCWASRTSTTNLSRKKNIGRGFWKAAYSVLTWVTGFLRWLFLLSLGIGLFNLLPLPIVDGGRMAQVFLHKLKGAEKGRAGLPQGKSVLPADIALEPVLSDAEQIAVGLLPDYSSPSII